MRRWIPTLAMVVAAAFVALAIPGSPVAAWLVDLLAGGDWRGLSEGVEPSRPADNGSRPAVRMAVGAMVTPERTYSDYRDLFSVVAERTGRRLELVQRKTYRELNDLVGAGTVDVAWVCTGAVADLDERGSARLLAVPVVEGRSDYHSYVIVREGSTTTSFDQLRGAVFAFTDPLSLTGRRVVVDLLTHRGLGLDSFFREVFYTHAHDSSIRAVRDGLADAACVDSLVYDYLADLDPEETSGTRVLWRSERYPIPPLVASSSLDNGLFEELQAVFLDLHNDSKAQPFLAHLRVESFSEGDSTVYFSK